MTALKQNLVAEYENAYDQIDASIRFFMMDNAEYYESLRNTTERLRACAVIIVKDFMSNGTGGIGYHQRVISRALNQLDIDGFINSDCEKYSHKDLYPEYY